VAYARKIGLSGIAITDHDAIDGSLSALSLSSADFTVLSGMEVSSNDGHILALNVTSLIPRGLSARETVEEIHSRGGIAIAAHPYCKRRNGVRDLVMKLPFDAVEAVNGHTFFNLKDPLLVCKCSGIPMVGGSDAHSLKEVGSVTVEYRGDILTDMAAGSVRIRSKPRMQLMINHGIGSVKRKLVKILR
jgi:predicted metal-dependent phosphoesterase TrpH